VGGSDLVDPELLEAGHDSGDRLVRVVQQVEAPENRAELASRRLPGLLEDGGDPPTDRPRDERVDAREIHPEGSDVRRENVSLRPGVEEDRLLRALDQAREAPVGAAQRTPAARISRRALGVRGLAIRLRSRAAVTG